jgi:hypothetical protein
MSWKAGEGYVIIGNSSRPTKEDRNKEVLEAGKEITVVNTNFKLVKI